MLNNELMKEKLEEYASGDDIKSEVSNDALNYYDNNENIKGFFEDLLSHGCQSGMIPGLVYYTFSNKNNTYYSYNPNTYIVFEHQENKDFTEKQWNILEKAQKKFDDLVFNAWQQLDSQYYYLISDESIIETIEANDYEFTEEGNLI